MASPANPLASGYAIDNFAPRTPPEFPETKTLVAERPRDVGIAFSGGGTRAAAATIGQLRGLVHNDWLADNPKS